MKKIFFYLIIFILAAVFSGCGSRIELLHDISESEANEAVAALLNVGIASSKIAGKEGLVSIDVDQSQVARAIAILNAEGLPRERFAKMGDVFKKEGLISSPLEERARYIWALSQELSATLAQIDGVIKARVHVVLPEKAGGGEPTLPSSAAVFIKHKQSVTLEDSVAQIKRLVSNSIPGLSSDKVTVVMIASTGRQDFATATEKKKPESLTKNDVDFVSEKHSKVWMIASAVALLVVIAASAIFLLGYRRRHRNKKLRDQVQTEATPAT